MTTKLDIKIILVYSPINKSAKRAEPYSTLNPDTNSDSPSAKSKGLRLVSAIEEIHHIKRIGVKITKNQT